MVDPNASSSGGQPHDVRGENEHDAGDQVDEAREHDFDRVDPLQVLVRQRQPEDREQHDSLRRAEVAAVDPGREHRDEGQRSEVPVLADATRAVPIHHPGQARLQDDQRERDHDERGHDVLERGRGKAEQEDRTDEPADRRGDGETEHPLALAGQLAPVADRARHRPRNQTDRVRDVGGHGRVAERQQHREREQRAAPDHGVDRAGHDARPEDRQGVQEGHVAAFRLPRVLRSGKRGPGSRCGPGWRSLRGRIRSPRTSARARGGCS